MNHHQLATILQLALQIQTATGVDANRAYDEAERRVLMRVLAAGGPQSCACGALATQFQVSTELWQCEDCVATSQRRIACPK